MDIVNEIKASFKQGSYLTQLIYINIAVFVLVNLITVFFFFAGESINDSPIISLLAIPADISELLWKPWTVITYMFLHEAFLHLLFNMLTLYFFSDAVINQVGQIYFIIIYFGSLIAGSLIAVSFHKKEPFYSAVGASGAVSGILYAAILLNPGMTLLFYFAIPIPGWIFAIGYLLFPSKKGIF